MVPDPPLPLLEAELALGVRGPDLESKRRMVSRTLDFLPDPSTVGAMGGLVATGDSPDLFLPLPLLCLACCWLSLVASLASSLFGRDIGLGILDLVSDVFLMPTTPAVGVVAVVLALEESLPVPLLPQLLQLVLHCGQPPPLELLL